MATALLRNGISRSLPRLRLDQLTTKRYIRTQNVLKRREPNDFGGGHTFQKGVHESVPKSEFHRTPPAGTRNIVAALVLGTSIVGVYFATKKSVRAKSLSPDSDTKKLPIYKKAEVAEHKTKENGIWVTYQGHVYDITEFVDMHPGGTKVLLAAGGALEPFWSMYPVHKESSVLHWLEKYRIGDMAPDEAKHVDTSDPFAGDPERHPALQVNSAKPFNAETPLELITDTFVTPNELFFVRNHLPVPNVDAKNYKLTVSGLGVKTMEFSLNDLKKKFKKHTVKATMECAGNRRAEMTEIKEVKGLMWKGTAISNAEWSGVLLRDVLKSCGFNVDDPKASHVQFEGYDKDPAAGGHYGASVPSELALNPQGDVLLAYEMNGMELPVDHGFPVRVVIPGTVGARNVKWLSKIVTSNEESKSHWQQNDYKGFNPSVDWNTIDYKNAIPINEAPVTSAICVPQPGMSLVDDEEVAVKGYAWSGGGRGIIRVDLSLDGGKTWQVATLQKDDSRYNRHWSWTLWEADLKIPKNHQGKVEIICKATDSSYNTQPDSVAGIWNVRGLLNNAWHKVEAKVPDSEETKPFGTPEIQSLFSAGWPHYMFQANFF